MVQALSVLPFGHEDTRLSCITRELWEAIEPLSQLV
jgi:hypothetical protein